MICLFSYFCLYYIGENVHDLGVIIGCSIFGILLLIGCCLIIFCFTSHYSKRFAAQRGSRHRGIYISRAARSGPPPDQYRYVRPPRNDVPPDPDRESQSYPLLESAGEPPAYTAPPPPPPYSSQPPISTSEPPPPYPDDQAN